MLVRQIAGALNITALTITNPVPNTDGTAALGTTNATFGPADDAWTLGLKGTPVAGEVWQLNFDGVPGLSLTGGPGHEPCGASTAGLAALLDAKPGYSAFATGATGTALVLTKNGSRSRWSRPR
jgi:hypothetical protein